MPYFLFKISQRDQLDLVRQLDLHEQYGTYAEARADARKLRAESSETGVTYKVMFAENRLSAEEQLLEKREKPVLMEHER